MFFLLGKAGRWFTAFGANIVLAEHGGEGCKVDRVWLRANGKGSYPKFMDSRSDSRSGWEWTGICIWEKKPDARPEEQHGSCGVHFEDEDVAVGEWEGEWEDEWDVEEVLAF